jgi:5-methylcytosine-specific restriction endonuclease McrA
LTALKIRGKKAYERYLNSDLWRKNRQPALDRAGNACEKCGAVEALNVHHLTYKRLGKELPKDLQVLCRPCHLLVHVKRPKPLRLQPKPPKPRSPRPKKKHIIVRQQPRETKRQKLVRENNEVHATLAANRERRAAR